eukprot:83939-Hanusia_phi.AAC.6
MLREDQEDEKGSLEVAGCPGRDVSQGQAVRRQREWEERVRRSGCDRGLESRQEADFFVEPGQVQLEDKEEKREEQKGEGATEKQRGPVEGG